MISIENVGLFFRGWLIVFFVALNTVFIAEASLGKAGLSGFMISMLWFLNARTAGQTSGFTGAFCYALGAAVGTVTGAWLGHAWR
jgi:hypothetical protein